jgi:hypothetical protein
MSGQFGCGKSFAALDLSVAVIGKRNFAGRRVIRQGGVLFIAAEGAFEIPIRLRGLDLDGKGSDSEPLPFCWTEQWSD